MIFPALSLTILPFKSLLALPFSLMSKAISVAFFLSLVFKFTLYAIKKSLTPIAVAPDFLLKFFPKSGFQSFFDIF